MRNPASTLALALAVAGCAGRAAAPHASAPRLPLSGEGEVFVYLAPLPPEAERLTFSLSGVALRPDRADAPQVPLQLAAGELSGRAAGQRLVAWGRLAPGEYAGLSVTAAAASLGDGERVRLVLEPASTEAPLPFRLAPGQAVVLWASLDPARSIRDDYGFTPALRFSLAPQTPPQVALYVTAAADAALTIADRRVRLVTGAVPLAGTPRGLALDRGGARAYVALEDADRVEVLDLASSATLEPVRLTPGDGPRELATTSDGMLAVVNARSRSLAFLDPAGRNEVGRVPLGDDPVWLLMDRAGRRAFVASRGTSTVTVVDAPRRARVATLVTGTEPVALALSRDEGRLYVAHRGSPDLAVFTLPGLEASPPVYVGPGVLALHVDARTDLVYLSRADGTITVHDPLSLQQVDRLELPAPVTRLAIDDAENTLFLLMPSRRAVAVVDLTSRALLAELPAGGEPHALAFPGERR